MTNDATAPAQPDTLLGLGSSDGLGLVERVRLLEQDHAADGWPAVQMRDMTEMADEIERLRAGWKEAADKALTYAESYEMAVARLVLAMDYMHPEQKRALNAAWAEKRAELRAVALRA